MNIITNPILSFIFCLITFSGRLAGAQPPSNRAVIRELHKILREDPFFKSRPATVTSDWLDALFRNLAQLLKYPLLIVLGIGVALGLSFLIRSLIPYIQGKSLPEKSVTPSANGKKDLPPNSFSMLYQQALDQSRSKLYKQALISLHKATVEYLLTKVIIAAPHKKYTNNDLKRKLSAHKNLYQPFCVITGYAEIAGFSTIDINQSDFIRALEVFEKTFL